MCIRDRRNILFLNFEGMHVRVVEDVKAIWDICELRCRAAGKRVGVIINYDRFRINQDMYCLLYTSRCV